MGNSLHNVSQCLSFFTTDYILTSRHNEHGLESDNLALGPTVWLMPIEER